MKVNIILSKTHEASITDTNILMFLFKKIKHKIEANVVEVKNYKCDNASMNIFIGNINPLLFSYAKTNILLADSDIIQKSNMYMLRGIDYVFTKTTFMANYLSNFLSKEQIVDIGWRSTDLRMFSTDKNFNKYLLFCHNTDDHHIYKRIIQIWNERLSETDKKLHVVNFNVARMNLNEITAKNIIIETNISQDNFESLFNLCGVHICLQEHESFSHYLNQSMLCRSLVIIPDVDVYKHLAKKSDESVGEYAFCITGKQTKHKTLFGTKFQFDTESFVSQVNNIGNIGSETLNILSTASRSDAIRNHARNDGLFKDNMVQIIKETLSKPKGESYLTHNSIDDDDLPSISIVTLTHNRKKFFRLAIFNFNQIDYPKNKLEWIVYDTSNDENQVEGLLPEENDRIKYNIKYFKNKVVETIGESRNAAMKQCSNDIIVFFDDDDYYPSTSVKKRISPLVYDPQITMSVCSGIGTFEINKYISFVDYPELTVSPSRRYRIGTLAVRREIIGRNENFWCDTSSINEFHTIFSSNLRFIEEISWDGVIVSLLHTQNTTHRVAPKAQVNERGEEVNECHFGFGNKLFKFITELDTSDEELIEREKLKEEKIKEMMTQQMAASKPPEESNVESGAVESGAVESGAVESGVAVESGAVEEA
jgi:glycosyltransferase involved in cell wall biosynthesis